MEHNPKEVLNSRLPGFYNLPLSERLRVASQISGLDPQEVNHLSKFGALTSELSDTFIENSIGTFSLPLGVATNFRINHQDYLIPMAVEESSVLAAASHGAKLARTGGGFKTSSTNPIMTGQIQVKLKEYADFDSILEGKKNQLIEYANRGFERLLSRGGGAKDITWHFIPEISNLIIHVHIHSCDAMGANIVNTMCEKLSTFMPQFFPRCEVGLCILTNLTDRRVAKAECRIPPDAFNHRSFAGHEVVQKIAEAWEFAFYDIYRATTHNKGVMNGIDPVVIATGNDWRAIEAGAHAFVARNGTYRPMTVWQQDSEGWLNGSIELPMAVGTVGGVTKLHPTAQTALKILGNPDARTLGEIIVAVGLAQNLSALRALATEGIQHGHMHLHQKNLDLLRNNQTQAN